MSVFNIKNVLLPLLLVSLVAPAVGFLTPVFGLTGRWLCMVLLAIYVILSWRKGAHIDLSLIVAGFFYLMWCGFTYFWSEVQELTGLKSMALILAVVSTFFGGLRWATVHQSANVLDFLWPWAIVAIIAAATGSAAETISTPTTDFSLHAGATYNSNMLGSLVALSTPLILWRLYGCWAVLKTRALWIGILASYLFFLYLTASRSAFLVFGIISICVLTALGRSRLALALLCTVLALSVVAFFAPDFFEELIARNVFKYSETGILYTREAVWELSYDAAMEGGWTGLGYGVSVGDNDFRGSVTALGYGREKGNSQLAIIEETGVVGLVLQLVFVLLLLFQILKVYSRASTIESRVLVSIIFGTLVGMIGMSIFEAWWVAPGSAEFGYFWAMAGIGIGLGDTVNSGAVRRGSEVGGLWSQRAV